MSQQQDSTTGNTRPRTRRERVGVVVEGSEASALITAIEEAEAAGVEQIWMYQNPVSLDALTIYAAALSRTERIRVGTSIVPTYPRHPLALAQQAATVAGLGPGRLRLGIGPSHRLVIEETYGLLMEAPLAQLKEYVDVLRAALWDGTVDHHGRFFTAKAEFTSTPRVPLLIAALGPGAFRLAGEVSDGAISWNCPVSYLLDIAPPALREGALAARRPPPPLVAHMWVAPSSDAVAVRAVARQRLAYYTRLPFFANMFAAAGYPLVDGSLSDALLNDLVIMGDEQAIAVRLDELLASGIDELLLTLIPIGDETMLRTRLFRLVGQL